MRRKFEIEFAVDGLKAFKIAERLLDQFYKRKGFFEDYSMPEYVLPSARARRSCGKSQEEPMSFIQKGSLHKIFCARGETGLFKVKNLDRLDIPVDKQVARFTMYTARARG